MFRKLPWLFSIVSFVLILIASSPIKYVINVPSAIVAVILPIFILLAIFYALLVIVFLAYPASTALTSAARRATLIDEA